MIYLSIIIPTRNRAIYLKDTLKSISEQEYENKDFEVIVIDNASTDNTVEIFENYANKIPNLRYLYQKKIGLHEGRNLGLKEAKGEILCYLDDDVYLFNTWLDGVRESFKNKDVVLVGGKNLPKYEVNPPDWIKNLWNGEKKIGYLSIIDLGDEIKEINPFLVYGCNFSIRKKNLCEAGGFHPDGFPQELIKYRGDGESYISKYIKDMGYKAYYNPRASVYHLVTKERMTYKYFKKRAYNQGISDSYSQVRTLKGKRIKIGKNLVLNSLRFLRTFFFRDNKYFAQEHLHGLIYHHIGCLIDSSLMRYVLKKNYLED